MTGVRVFKGKITAKGTEIAVLSKGEDDDFISLTDIAKYKNADDAFIVINNWMRVRNTIEYLGLWEQLNNPNFKPIEFDRFLHEAGANAFTLSPQKWVNSTNAIGISVTPGRGGGTYAHKDIAFKFAAWISTEFELYVIKDYQRLKSDENSRISLEWNVKRILSKINYRVHTDAIKNNLIPKMLTAGQRSFVYADEADVLNVALFGVTAVQWRSENKDKEGNMRDYASIEQLLVLANLENVNALYISKGVSQSERIEELNHLAREQLSAMLRNKSVDKLKKLENKKP
ncbi:MAG: KilA-N domain-containing protein [Nitrososphaerota archaeon]|nr:KilA-N domain-containing protein [Nitrososphaerota archaeon]